MGIPCRRSEDGAEQSVPPPPLEVYLMCPRPAPLRTTGQRAPPNPATSLLGAAWHPKSLRQKSSHLKAKGGVRKASRACDSGNKGPSLVTPCPCSIRRRDGWQEGGVVGCGPRGHPVILVTLPAERPRMGGGPRLTLGSPYPGCDHRLGPGGATGVDSRVRGS